MKISLVEEEQLVLTAESVISILKKNYEGMSPRSAVWRVLSGGSKYKPTRIIDLMEYRGYKQHDIQEVLAKLLNDGEVVLSPDCYLSLKED